MMARRRERGLSEGFKAGIFRWWFTGAVYFFIAFGTSLGTQSTPIDLLFFLGVGLGAGTALLFNPIIFGVFNVKRPEGLWSLPYGERKIWQNVLLIFIEVFRAWLLVTLVYLTYQAINLAAQQLMSLPEGTVTLGGEPILFATFYLIYYSLLGKLIEGVKEAVAAARAGKEGTQQ